jgi:hypothetical protein
MRKFLLLYLIILSFLSFSCGITNSPSPGSSNSPPPEEDTAPGDKYAKLISAAESQTSPSTVDITYEVLDANSIDSMWLTREEPQGSDIWLVLQLPIFYSGDFGGIENLTPRNGIGVTNDDPVSLGSYNYRLYIRLKDGKELNTSSLSVTISNLPAEWTPTSELLYGGGYYWAWMMSDGKVLAGGEVYDSSTGNWSIKTDFSFGADKSWFRPCKIAGQDKLIWAEFPASMFTTTTGSDTIIYDYSSNSWSKTDSYKNPRWYGLLSCLNDGRVVLSGGRLVADINAGSLSTTNSVEIYDPSTGLWTEAAPMNYPRLEHLSVVLSDGKLLVVGGVDRVASGPTNSEKTAEVYDPVNNTWTLTANLNKSRIYSKGILLKDGRVLAAGGQIPNYGYTDGVEIYDPSTNTWAATGSMHDRKTSFTMNLLKDGTVMVTGGRYQHQTYETYVISGQEQIGTTIWYVAILTTAEIYNPVSGIWTKVASIPFKREEHFGAVLDDGRLIIGGGWDAMDTLYKSVYLYSP